MASEHVFLIFDWKMLFLFALKRFKGYPLDPTTSNFQKMTNSCGQTQGH